jgi:hypothetical protein
MPDGRMVSVMTLRANAIAQQDDVSQNVPKIDCDTVMRRLQRILDKRSDPESRWDRSVQAFVDDMAKRMDKAAAPVEPKAKKPRSPTWPPEE